jgi:hypothetical protein
MLVMEEICKFCKRSFIYNRDKGHRHNLCCSCKTTQRRAKVKRRAVEYKGGKCTRCGYDKCDGALDFHHTNDDKEFGIADSYNKSWERLKTELDKCELICANCHREEHHVSI